MEKLGFVGLGNMGGGMSSNLVKHGYEVTVHDINPAAVKKLVDLGAKSANSPKEVAEQSEIIIISLPYPADVEQVVCSPNGILEGAKEGATIIDMSTIDPPTTRKLAEIAAKKGVSMLDAPVAGGGPSGAAVGKQTIMVGGKKEVFERCKGVLNVLGNNVIHIGDNGMGLVVKLCFNMYGGMGIIAAAETFAFGVKLGVDAKTLYNILNTARGGDWTLENKCPYPDCAPKSPANQNFEPEFFLDLYVKDIGLVQTTMNAQRMPLLMSTLTQQMFEAASNIGLGKKDISGIAILVRRLAGLEE